MRKKLQEVAKRIEQNPVASQALTSMKPQKSLWGFLGVIFFFILPEVVTYFYGVEITAFANTQILAPNTFEMHYYYKALVMMFGDGVSWLNLIIGFALLIWLFF